MRPRSRVVALLVAAATTMGLSACGDSSTADGGDCPSWGDATVRVGGGATGGQYFVMGGELSRLINEELDCVRATSAAGTSAEFIRSGLDVVLTIGDNAYSAWSGVGGNSFKEGEKYDYFYGGTGFGTPFFVVALKDSPLDSVSDLGPDDTIATNAPTLTQVLDEYLAVHDVSPKTTIIEGYDQSLTALRRGQIDAIHYGSAHPNPALLEAQSSMELKIVKSDPDALERYLDGDKLIVEPTTVKAGLYDWITEDEPAFSRAMHVIYNKDLDEDLAYEITKLFYERVEDFARAVPPAKEDTLEAVQTSLDSNTVKYPIHPGARRYFEENDVSIPDTVPAVDAPRPNG
ncbi:TAXI family TRAP transporter solute-binding subunit [Actinophytocola sediminis]